MTINDDRNEEQKKTHYLAVVAKDTYLSRKDEYPYGVSRCAWAVPKQFVIDGRIDKLLRWVSNRSYLVYVSIVNLNNYRPRRTKHFQIYVVDEDHPSLK